MLHEWTASLVEEKFFFQLFVLEGAVYLWIGMDDSRFDSLGIGVPAAKGGRSGSMPSATTLIGGSGGDAGSQLLAQRLSRKFGLPLFVSLNLRDEPQLRLFAEKEALRALAEHVSPAQGTVGSRVEAPALSAAARTPAAAESGAACSPGGLSAGADHPGRGARVREVFEVHDDLAHRAAELLLEAAAAAIARSGVFVVALSGGSIPKLLAPKLLAAGGRAQLDRWRFFLADERHVPESSPDSNMGEWRQALLRPAAIQEEHIFPIADELPLDQAAKAYEAQLLSVLRSAAAAAQTAAKDTAGDGRAASVDVAAGRIDAIVLGMGPDGHTASLFPGHPIVDVESCAVAPISDSPKPPSCRITLTLPVLNASRLALFVVTGASKAHAVRSAFEPEPGVPAGLVLAAEQTIWCLDAPAAAELLQGESTSAALYG